MTLSIRARTDRARHIGKVLVGSLLALALIGCAAGTTSDGSPVATTTVDLPKSYRFAPAAITVEVGETVTWTNNDNFSHNVDLVDDEAEPLAMAPGESVSHAFDIAGTFAYVCSLHPADMTGSVVVTGG